MKPAVSNAMCDRGGLGEENCNLQGRAMALESPSWAGSRRPCRREALKMRSYSSLRMALIPLVLASACTSAPTSTSQEYVSFTDSDFGVKFDYPATMVPQVKRDSQVESGVTLSSIAVQFLDRREVAMIFLQAVDDPVLASSPGWYPPSEAQLEIFAALDLGKLDIDQTSENGSAIDAAVMAASSSTIAGFPALPYSVFLNNPDLGYLYIRGASIVTPARTYALMAIGGLSAESPSHDTVKPERVDEIWSRLLSTIVLEE